ncbi:hypothetical protein DL240_07390 [Lujinxingia litoralis]|uniref:YeeE/YedE family protein n=1 Tax=Lujinxingia litoralis TaxID=2211119 RepID=A0A328CAE0_9DELT|nr:YeeE/YedE family protein [Lujinxingia litoralis]RAL23964.1 hypothetical protein DL240_07390 [Lujinxingia litoralis]
MIRHIAIALSGLLFAIGLGVSQMTRPEKVLGFLDVFGNWDPSLAFVMGGAVLVYTISYPLISKRHRPLFAPRFYLPTRKDIDKRLVIGGALFGIGWGLGGFCPGPALTTASSGLTSALIFVPAMLVGILFADKFLKPKTA